MRLSSPKKMVRVIRNLGQRLCKNTVETSPEVEVTAPMRPAPRGTPLQSESSLVEDSDLDSFSEEQKPDTFEQNRHLNANSEAAVFDNADPHFAS